MRLVSSPRLSRLGFQGLGLKVKMFNAQPHEFRVESASGSTKTHQLNLLMPKTAKNLDSRSSDNKINMARRLVAHSENHFIYNGSNENGLRWPRFRGQVN